MDIVFEIGSVFNLLLCLFICLVNLIWFFSFVIFYIFKVFFGEDDSLLCVDCICYNCVVCDLGFIISIGLLYLVEDGVLSFLVLIEGGKGFLFFIRLI